MTSSMPEWITVAECARARGVTPQAMLRTLKALDKRAGGQVLRRDSARGRWKVNLRGMPQIGAYATGLKIESPEFISRIEQIEAEISALRQAFRRLRRRKVEPS